MKTYIVRARTNDELDTEGAFQSVLRADPGAQFELEQEDDGVETFTLKTSRDVSRLLDQADLVISYEEV